MPGPVISCIISSFDEPENGPALKSVLSGLNTLGYKVKLASVNQDFDQVRSDLEQWSPGEGVAPDLFILLIYAFGSTQVPNKIYGSKTDPGKCLDLVQDILQNVGRVECLQGKSK